MKDERSLMDSLMSPETREETSNQRAMIAGATPLLVGLLTGNTGDAVEIASKGLMAEDARKQKEDETLMSYLRKKDVASKKKSDRLYQVRDPETGDIRYVTPDEAQGELAPRRRRTVENTMDIAKGRSGIRQEEHLKLGKQKAIKKDPVTGKEFFVDKATGETEEIGFSDAISDLAPRQQNQVIAAQKEFQTDTKETRKGLDAAEQFMEAIRIGNPISDQFAIFKLAKTADSGGRLSDQDVAMFGGSKDLKGRMDQIKETARTGRLTPANQKFMMQIAEAMMKTNAGQLKRKAQSFSRRRGKAIGIDLLPYIMEKPVVKGDVKIDKIDVEIKKLEKELGM